MIKKKQFIILIIWIITIFVLLIWNHNNYKKVAAKNLEGIEWELLNCCNYFMRNAQNVDYNEINQSIKHLDMAIKNYQDNRITLIRANSEKTIDIIDSNFQKIASSNIVTEKNIEQFYKNMNELRVAINDSLKQMQFGDISKESSEAIFNTLEKLKLHLVDN
ncbi:hypothetical protein DFR58_11744 [Anaerobacterium chartisolvens]|uniref:Uncharacterized protein n=1 Tax=Anaerobacterium chartisolvens TaxID=1297424 RepID=A0A369B1A8_9FIRM|nr:hypothetical protein [Anaerobacterium chartisolvens]RCX13504.1 hypothetical protein DFR58_11744 [Anaerobacterium chartisolvens]